MMNAKMDDLKETFSEILRLCHEIDSRMLSDAVDHIEQEVLSLEDDDVDTLLSLLTEVLMHVNDLDGEYLEQFEDVINDINELAEDIRNDADL